MSREIDTSEVRNKGDLDPRQGASRNMENVQNS